MSDAIVKDIYKKQGINLVPIPKGSGKSVTDSWKKFQHEMFTDKLPDEQDFAVILGITSGNLIVLDFDHCDDIEELNKIKKDILNSTLVVRTGNGYHAYFRLTGELPSKANTFLENEKSKMEVKGQGAYIVGASSNHYDRDGEGKWFPTGKKYTIISNTTKIATLHANGQQIIEKITSLGWHHPTGQLNQNGQCIIIPTMDLEKGGWSSGERYNNGFKLALRRFHMGWNYEDIINEANQINQSCKPPHTTLEVERWVNDAHTQFQKNVNDPDQKYFGNKENNNNNSTSRKKKDHIEETTALIEKNHHFICLRDSDELLVWNGKIFIPNFAEPLIKEECEKWMDDCRNADRSEVIGKIKAINYEDREKFDSDPYKLTLENEILYINDLHTEKHSPKNLSCVLLPVSFTAIPGISSDKITQEKIFEILKNTKFLEYLSSCFTVNEKFDYKQFFTVLEIMASCLIKKQFDKAFMFIGTGSNGKSVLLDYLEQMIGSQNVSNITIHDIELERFSKAELFGKMANVFADIESDELKKTGNLKVIISGDSITAEKKHLHPFKFKPYTKLIFSANRFPYVHDQSDGFFRRFAIVEWKKQFVGYEKDPHLRRELQQNKEEMSKVFSLLVYLAKDLLERGHFKFEDNIESLRKKWNQLSDPIMQFINEVVVEEEGEVVSKQEAYARYKDFCIENELRPVTIKKFGMIFGEYYETAQKKDSNGINKKFWIDIKLKKPHIQERLKQFED